MKLVYFLTVGGILSLILGEFGQYPFGTTSNSVSLLDILVLLSVVFLMIWKIGIKKELNFPREFLLLLGFWIVAMLSLIINWDFRGYLYLLRYILYSAMFLVGYFIIKDRVVNLDYLIELIAKLSGVFAILGIVQLLVYPDFKFLTDYGYDPHIGRLSATFLDPNYAGLFLNTGLIFSIYLYLKRQEKSWLIYSLLSAVGVILTFSRGGWLVLLIVSIVLLGYRSKKLLGFFLIGVLLAVLFIPRVQQRVVGALNIDVTAKERIESWNKGITVFYQSPLLGIGFNNTRFALEENNLIKVFSSDGGNSGAGVDSSFIFILMTTGIIGMISFLSFWIYVIRLITKQTSNFLLKLVFFTLLMGLSIGSQFVNGLFYPPLMFLLYLLTGAILGTKKT